MNQTGGWRRLGSRGGGHRSIASSIFTMWCTIAFAHLFEKYGIAHDIAAILLGVLFSLVALSAAVGVCLLFTTTIARIGATCWWPPQSVPSPPNWNELGFPEVKWEAPPSPKYPPIARAIGQSGWVALHLQVDTTGKVCSYKIADQAPHRIFERAAVLALNNARLAAPPVTSKDREIAFNIIFAGA